MNRRNFLLGIVGGGAALGAGGVVWLGKKSNLKPLTIDAAIQTLDELMTQKVVTSGEWKLDQILIHCAQSVEYSIDGFPEHKSDLFKDTVGQLAFAAFESKGEMRHGLSEAIPGAPSIQVSDDIESAYRRFRASMDKFKGYNGALAEHFAYGALTKREYEVAHAMHFYNHLLEIEAVA